MGSPKPPDIDVGAAFPNPICPTPGAKGFPPPVRLWVPTLSLLLLLGIASGGIAPGETHQGSLSLKLRER